MCLPARDGVAYESATPTSLPRRHRRALPLQQEDDGLPHVRFAAPDQNQVHVMDTALSCLSPSFVISKVEARRELWYQKEDIQSFRQAAAQQSQRILRKQTSYTRATSGTHDEDSGSEDEHDDGEEEDDVRGLEVRLSHQRQDAKQFYVHRILEAQDDDCTPEEIGRIARDCCQWSRRVALAQAHKDYYAAYHPHLSGVVLPSTPSSTSTSSSSCGMAARKRSLWGSSSSSSSFEQQATGRRVRCRMY